MRKAMYIALAVAAVVAAAYVISHSGEGPATQGEQVQYATPTPPVRQFDISGATVSGVVDSETLQLQDGRRLKLIGIAQPKAGGPTYRTVNPFQYTQAVEQMVVGKQVNVEQDIQKDDSAGRILGYVYLRDGTFVNAELVRQGYAVPDPQGLNTKYKDYFYMLYRQAQQNNRGFWR